MISNMHASGVNCFWVDST